MRNKVEKKCWCWVSVLSSDRVKPTSCHRGVANMVCGLIFRQISVGVVRPGDYVAYRLVGCSLPPVLRV